jgi:hypothetical protein
VQVAWWTQPQLTALHGCRVLLAAETDNVYDALAITVHVAVGSEPALLLGYLPKGVLSSAHVEGWGSRAWFVDEAGLFGPSETPFVRISCPDMCKSVEE